MPRESSSRNSVSSLFIRNVHKSTRVYDLKKVFERYGTLKDVYIPLDYSTREPRGFAYVQFDDSRDARNAIKNEDGAEVNGNRISVQFASGDRKTPREMRRKIDGYDRHRSDRYRSRSRSRSRDYRRRDRSHDRSRRYSRDRSPSNNSDRSRRSQSENSFDRSDSD